MDKVLLDKNKKKILQVLFPGLGGVSSVAFSLVEAERKNKKKYKHIFCFYGNEKLFKGFKKKCNNLNILNKSFITNINFLSKILVKIKLLKYIFYNKPNVIILHNSNVLFYYVLKLFFKCRLIYVHHTPDISMSIINWIAYIVSNIFSDVTILVARKKKSDFIYKLNNFLFKKKVFIIENGINYFRFNNFKKIKKRYSFYCGMAGRFVEAKKQLLLINIIKNNLEKIKFHRIQMIFAGSGDTEKSLKKYVKTHNLEKYIKFYGNLSEDETIKWFSKLDVYLQISEDETTSTSILQAMSMNLPIIASNIGGNKKLKKKFNQSNNITLVENNEKEILKKIIYLKKNPILRASIGKSARLGIKKNFNFIKMFNNYEKKF